MSRIPLLEGDAVSDYYAEPRRPDPGRRAQSEARRRAFDSDEFTVEPTAAPARDAPSIRLVCPLNGEPITCPTCGRPAVHQFELAVDDPPRMIYCPSAGHGALVRVTQ